MMEWSVQKFRKIAFADLEKIQKDLGRLVREKPDGPYMLVSEPKATFTHGRFAGEEKPRWSLEEIRKAGVDLYPVGRGGKWTFHGPGQILIYPIFSMRALGYSSLSVSAYLIRFRQILLESLLTLGVPAAPCNRPFGIYAKGKKIASFGVSIEQGITQHGVAVYLEDQSGPFQGITPCGVPGDRIGCLREFGVPIDWDKLSIFLTDSLKNGLNRRNNGLQLRDTGASDERIHQ